MAGKREVGDIFAQQHAALNAAQREAVSAIEGPVMVVAGPGTGKTRVLTLRIANILHKTGVRPEAILALTFTETGASEMRRRLAELIGAASYHLHIFTFHGFCNEVIGRYPESFPGLAGRTATDEVEQIDILEAAFRTLELALLKPFGDPLHYVRPARTAIGSIKREGVSPDDFLGRLRRDETRFSGIEDLYHDSGPHKGKMKGKYQRARRELDKNVELAAVYRRYQEELAARKRYDYDDMILEVLNALRRDQALTLSLQEQSAYILVDEHQDTNNAQNAVLEYISGGSERPNLFVVGDEKQAIFRFQGASLENFLYFKQRYPGARLITLTENYRSTQHILDLAQSVISHNRRSIATILKGLATELVAKTAVAPVLAECYRFARAEDEHRFVAGKIQELIAGGVRPEEIAVLYRENRESDAVARALARRAVPYRIESARDILDDALVRKLLRLLKAVHDLSDDEALFAALHLDFLGIAPLDVYKVSAGRGARRRGLATIMADRAALEALGVEAPDAMGALAEKLLSWYRRARTDDALSVLTMIIEESGFSRALLKDDGALERIEVLRRLTETARTLAVGKRDFLLGNFLRYIETLESHGIPIKYERPRALLGAVRLMTAHGAKGLEFDYVFLVNVTDGHWGNKRSRELFRLPSLALAAYEQGDEPERSEGLHAVEREPRLKGATIVSRIGAPEGAKRLKGADELPDALDEERRLFYVALTRARRMVYLSHADEDLEGRERRPSQFLFEMKPELLAEGDGAAYEEAAALVPAPAVLRPASGLLARDRATLREFFYERPLSATALNNFLACPWRYFYTNLVRMPRADTRAQRYGLAVHGALKDFFDALRNAPAPKAYLTDAFVRALERKALTESEFGELSGKGLRVLEGYYERYHESWCTATENEFRVRGVELPARVLSRPLALSGIIDKIEYLGPDAVNVVDYKTGRPRSRAAIEGKTKHGDGGYKRQLVFYKLLLERGTGLTMTGAELDFIEPDKRGVFHRERFLVDDAEVEELTELIYEVAEKITGFSFWDERCGQKDCAFCALRNEMQ